MFILLVYYTITAKLVVSVGNRYGLAQINKKACLVWEGVFYNCSLRTLNLTQKVVPVELVSMSITALCLAAIL